jgi:two-component system sensor histidine kinase ArlS
MKRHFLALLVVLLALVSLATILVSNYATGRSLEKLIMERAANRLSIAVWGFNATSADVDLYSYIEFDYEVLSISKNGFPIFQYGSAALDPGDPGIRRIERRSGSYDFTLLLDFRAEFDKYIEPIRMTIRIIAAVYAILFAVFGWIFIGIVANPIAGLAQVMVKISSRNLRVRIPLPSRRDEIRQLIGTFNAMMDDIAGTYERQVQFVEDMTHDIATPVQILEGYRQLIERHGASPGLVDEYLEASKVQLARLRDMTVSFKNALAVERIRRVEWADASSITDRNAVYYRELHPEIAIVADIGRDISFPVAPEDLERIEHILLDNAVKYGRDGGRIEIHLGPREFRVRDFGPGIPEAEKGAIFERYHRAPDAARGGAGSGIGLAILKRFSEEYGFGISLESKEGEGSTFTLRFQDPPSPR